MDEAAAVEALARIGAAVSVRHADHREGELRDGAAYVARRRPGGRSRASRREQGGCHDGDKPGRRGILPQTTKAVHFRELASRARVLVMAALISVIADTGVVITRNRVIRSACRTGRPAAADDTSIEAMSTQPVPRVVPMVGGCMRA